MYVCICNGVTDEHIYQAAQAGCDSVADLTRYTGCGSTCGCCLDMAEDLLQQALAESDIPLSVAEFHLQAACLNP